jgi:WD40 repeat protein
MKSIYFVFCLHVNRLRGHKDQVTDLHILEDTRRIVSSSKDKLVKVPQLRTFGSLIYIFVCLGIKIHSD